jgi:hypothetical protein
MLGINEEANEIIDKIIDIYDNYRLGYCLQEGDIILIDNRRMIHGRSGFCPKYDGFDRFLIRCFGIIFFSYKLLIFHIFNIIPRCVSHIYIFDISFK